MVPARQGARRWTGACGSAALRAGVRGDALNSGGANAVTPLVRVQRPDAGWLVAGLHRCVDLLQGTRLGCGVGDHPDSFQDGGEPSIALPGMGLTLLEAHSGREIAAQVTASDGSLVFEGLAPGLYFLRVAESADVGLVRPWGSRREVKGEIPILLDPVDSSALDAMRLQIAFPSCGFPIIYKTVQ